MNKYFGTFYFASKELHLPFWELIKVECPGIASRMLAEFKRIGGFIPYDPGFAYLIHAEGTDYYKIGKSINPDRRILQISPKMPFKTRPIRTWRSYYMSLAESRLHEKFADSRTNGEWFELDEQDINRLLLYEAEEIMYAYASTWARTLRGKDFESIGEYRASELYRLDKIYHLKNNFADFSIFVDPQILRDQAFASMNFVQFYLDAIHKDLADVEYPPDIAEQLERCRTENEPSGDDDGKSFISDDELMRLED